MCTCRNGGWLQLRLTARPGHAQKELLWVGTSCPTPWTASLCTLYCQLPYRCGDGSAPELITCDWIKYFILYLFLVRTEFGLAVTAAKSLTIWIPSFALSAIKIRTKGKSLLYVAAEDPVFNTARLRQHSLFFQTN